MSYPVLQPAQWNPKLQGYYSVLLDGSEYGYQGAAKAYAISAPTANTVRFELHDGDQALWDTQNNSKTSERVELAGRATMANDQAMHISYGFTLEPGAANTAKWLVLGQLHQGLDDSFNSGPAVSVGLDGEHMLIQGWITGADGKAQPVKFYEDPYTVERGHQYSIDIKVEFDPSGHNGRLVVTRDGVEIVDYTGSLGDPAMTSSYWAEGIYREGSATETVAADYTDLKITTGSAVTFPATSAFVAPPKIAHASFDGKGAAASGGYAVTLTGTAKAGASVAVYENQKLVGTGIADSSGNIVVKLSNVSTGNHTYTTVAKDGTGASSPVSAGVDIMIGTAAQIVSQGASLNGDTALVGVYVIDTHVLSMPDAATLNNFWHYANLVGKTQGGVLLQSDYGVTGKAWDREVDTYSTDGTLISQIRLAAAKPVLDAVYDNGWSRTQNYNANGSSIALTTYQGKTRTLESYDASGHKVYAQYYYDVGGQKTDYYAVDGTLSKTVIAKSDGTSLTKLYVAGGSYASELDYTSGGKIVATGRYDAAGHLLTATDSVAGTTTSYSWNASGTLVSYKLAASDKSYTVTTLTADGVHVARTDHFSSAGKLLGSDTIDPGQIGQATITKDVALISAFVATAAMTLPGADISAALTANVPTIASATVTSDHYDVAITGTGRIGSQVTILDGQTIVGNAIVDGTGHFAATLNAGTSGSHTYSVSERNPAGDISSPSSATTISIAPAAVNTTVESDPAGTGSSTPPASTPPPSTSPVTVAVPVTVPDLGPGKTLTFNSLNDLLAYARVYANVATTGPQLLHSYAIAVGSGYDHQSYTYDMAKTVLQSQRFLNGALVQDTANVGYWSASLALAADGTSSLSVHGTATSGITIGYDAAGAQTSRQLFFTDGSKRTENLDPADGHVTAATTYNADGSRLQVGYSPNGVMSYVNIYDRTATALEQVKYDTAGHITSINDLAHKGTVTFSYDALGTPLNAKLKLADGTYSVTSYNGDLDHAGTVAHYSAKGVLLYQDAVDPVGTLLRAVPSAIVAAQAHVLQPGFLYAGTGDQSLTAGADTRALIGGPGNDTLIGNGNDQILVAGAGVALMTGGGGNDLFAFKPGSTGSSSAVDRITDFAQGDRIDLSLFENAIGGHAGFSFIGTSDFGHHAGELQSHELNGNTYVSGDLDGDGVADFTIRLDGHHVLSTTDFLL